MDRKYAGIVEPTKAIVLSHKRKDCKVELYRITMYSVFKEVCIAGRGGAHMRQCLTVEMVKSCYSLCISYDSETYCDNQYVPMTTGHRELNQKICLPWVTLSIEARNPEPVLVFGP